MFAGLSLDQAPPFKGPLKFFLTAPLFGIFASLLIIFGDKMFFLSPQTIIATHFITIGFMLFIVFGALQQMLPVIAGVTLKRPLLVSNISYGTLIVGLISFSIAFYTFQSFWFILSAIFLFIGISIFLSSFLIGLVKIKLKTWIVYGMTFSLLFLLFAVLFGIYMLISKATDNLSSSYYDIASLHYNYMFFGFLGLMIISITFQVVSMFWVSTNFTKNEQKNIIDDV